MKTVKKKMSKLWFCKIAIEIPERFREVTDMDYPGQISMPDKIVHGLMRLFSSAQFVYKDMCNPDLLVIDVTSTVSLDKLNAMKKKINNFLAKFEK